jgi:divalent metal cation (Fe/Co/Zn/Cd) transporter
MMKEDKAILLLSLYILSLIIGLSIGFFMYKSSVDGLKKDLNQCIDAYNNDIEKDFINNLVVKDVFRNITKENKTNTSLS